MRAVIQRVSKASITVEGTKVGEIGKGLLVFLGIEKEDSEADLNYLFDKIINLRVFEDEQGKMNLSVEAVKGELLVVSQFTLCGDCRKGRRPSFDQAAEAEIAKRYYERFIGMAKERGLKTSTGKFQAHMLVGLENDGPVTILLDSRKIF